MSERGEQKSAQAENADLQEWRARARNLKFREMHFIHGKFVSSLGSESLPTINPATGGVIANYPMGDARDVDMAVRSSRGAFPRWSALALKERKRLLLQVADAISKHREELALLDTVEMGKPITLSLGDVDSGIAFLRYYAEAIDKWGGEIAPTDRTAGMTLVTNEPWGVIGGIVPWNFPFFNACLSVAPALAAGNTITLKPSEFAPSSALLFAQIANEVGLPDGVLNVVSGAGTVTGQALARHSGVDKLHFTGSLSTGRQIMRYSAESNGKPVMLELGGKSPQVIFADAANIEKMIPTIASAAFFNSGQVCVARSRLIVQATVANELVDRLVAHCKTYEAGDPLDPSCTFGPLGSARQYIIVERAVKEALRTGATAATGVPVLTSRHILPIVLRGVPAESEVIREELFGPVLTVQEFETDEEALILANDSPLGLAATVWTKDLGRAMTFGRQLDAGRVEVRCAAGAGAPLEAFGAEPFRSSGFGAQGGRLGFESYLRRKAIDFITK